MPGKGGAAKDEAAEAGAAEGDEVAQGADDHDGAAGDGGGKAGGGKAGGGGEEEEEEDDGLLIATKRVTKEDFFIRLANKNNPPIRGDSLEERAHWSRPRRWDVRLWDVQLADVSDQKRAAFCNFMFGNNREEFLVKRRDQPRPSLWISGRTAKEFTTPCVVDEVNDKQFTEMNFERRFQWYGSYMDLENQTLRIETWNYSAFFVNKLDAYFEAPLLNFVKGSISNEVECVKMDKFGVGKVRNKLIFNLYFQEIYAFELCLSQFRLTDPRPLDQAVAVQKRGEGVLTHMISEYADSDDDSDSGSEGSDHSPSGRKASNEPYKYRIELVMPGNKKYWSSSKVFVSTADAGANRDYNFSDEIRKMHFRGTLSQLHTSTAMAKVYTDAPPAVANLEKPPRGSKGKWILHSTARLSLSSCLARGDLKTDLTTPLWVQKLDVGKRINQRLGYLQGHISAENKPRYSQLDDMENEVDATKTYLFVKVIKVDRIVINDTRPVENFDTWVEVTFDGVTKRTRIRQDDISPAYNEELVFELNLPLYEEELRANKNNVQDNLPRQWEEIGRKGPAHFDVWMRAPMANDHMGSCEVFLNEILYDKNGQPQKTIAKRFKDRSRRGASSDVQVRAFRGFKRLAYVWGDGSQSHLYVEMWFMPELYRKAKIPQVKSLSKLPVHLLEQFDNLRLKWESKIAKFGRPEALLNRRDEDREFVYTVPCQWKSLVNMEKEMQKVGAKADAIPSGEGSFFAPRFITMIKPPAVIGNRNAVMHYISCFPYVAKQAQEPLLMYTPDFLSKMRKGDPMDHALLHACLMLGLLERAFVCVGTSLRQERHAWVMTIEADGSLKFWEPFAQPQWVAGRPAPGEYTLQGRFAHPEFVAGGSRMGSLEKEELRSEIRRRKRLLLQWARDGGVGPLELPCGKLHEHPLRYIDVSDHLSGTMFCSVCGDQGARPGYWRGFKCMEPGCGFSVCWKDADEAFADEFELEGLEFDATLAYDFSMGNPDSEEFTIALPYRSVEIVFNHTNIWANLQNKDPKAIFWDLWNPIYWHAFIPRREIFQPCFDTDDVFREVYFRDEVWVSDTRAELVRYLHCGIQRDRSSRNLETHFVRNAHLISFLEAGLTLYHMRSVREDKLQQEINKQIKDWEALLRAKTPPKNRVGGMALHFNFCDPELVLAGVLKYCDFLETRSKTAKFAVAVHVVPLPGDIVSMYVYICCIQQLSEVEFKDELESRSRAEKVEAKDKTREVLLELRDARLRNEGGLKLGLAAKFKDEFAPEKKKATLAFKSGGADLSNDVLDGGEAGLLKQRRDGGAEAASPAPRKRRAMTGFDEFVHSRFVAVGVTQAEYIGSKAPGSYSLCGGIIGNGPLDGSGHGKYFEVKVMRVTDHHLDGLSLGVTTRSPDDLTEVPETMDQVHPSWIAGFRNNFWDGSKEAWTSIPFKNERLRVGDRVGFLVGHQGSVVVGVNSKVVFRWQGSIPVYQPLFAVVDLLGNCDAVELVRGARPPPSLVGAFGGGQQQDANLRPLMEGFHQKIKGHSIGISKDGLNALHKTGDSGDMYGGVMSDGPLPVRPNGSVFFEIKVETTKSGPPDGLAVGVGAAPPEEVGEIPETIDALGSCWVLGFDGQAFDSTAQAWSELEWNPKGLKVGDRVGVLVTAGGMLRVFVNGRAVANGPRGIPVKEPLYALVDLIGCTRGVSLMLNAEPPNDAKQRGLEQEHPVIDLVPEMSGFARVGRLVSLSPTGKDAKYLGQSGTELFGSLLGNGPLRSFSKGWYFEVVVTETRKDLGLGQQLNDGMAIGVTTRGPTDLERGEMPQTVDELDPCWALGFDGSQWDGLQLHWSVCNFLPSKLSRGNLVGLLVTPRGETRVFVDGRAVAEGPSSVPVDRPLFGVVDLIGATVAVSLNDGAPPPQDIEVPDGKKMRRPPTAQAPTVAELVYQKMTGWDRKKAGQNVQVEKTGLLTAIRLAEPSALFGGVVGNGQLACSEAGIYFEVVIDRVGTGEPDGLAIGVTSTPLDKITELPETLDKVPNTWLVGFDGSQWDGRQNAFSEANWQPANLRIGDRVGVHVALDNGAMSVYLNSKRRAAGPSGIPCGKPLFAVADLIGNTQCISLLPDARLPVELPKLNRGGTGFSRAVLGKQIRLSADGYSATKSPGSGENEQLHGTAVGAGELREFSGKGRYFEIVVDKTRAGQPDGLAVGVTAQPPDEVRQPPQTSDSLTPSWLVGFDGATWDGANLKWGMCDWDGRDLQVGDTVGVLVTQRRGEMFVFVNEKACVAGPTGIPDIPLYAVVDLLGSIRAVTLATAPEPPASAGNPTIMAPAGAAAKSRGEPGRQAATAGAAPETASPAAASSASGAVPGGRSAAGMASPSPPAKAKKPATKKGGGAGSSETTGFHRTFHGPRVTVSEDGSLLTRRGGGSAAAAGAGGCVAMTDGRIAKASEGYASFRLSVTATEVGFNDGLAVGVTTRPAFQESRSCPETAELIDPSWLVGFDGASWDGARQEWGLSKWMPAKLLRGDVVEVRISREGELQVLVNRRLQAAHSFRIPAGAPLFGIVDLLGNTAGVALLSSGPSAGSSGGGGARGVEAPAAAAAATASASGGASAEAKVAAKAMAGFRTTRGSNISISADGRSAIRRGEAASGCVVTSDGVLPPGRDGEVATFSFHVISTSEGGSSDGIGVGVSTAPPSSLQAPESADQVTPSWLIGFDGATWDGTTKDWGFSQWNASGLGTGDHVRVIVTKSGMLEAIVNTKVVASHKMNIPAGAPLYAIVDLVGRTSGISMGLAGGGVGESAVTASSSMPKVPAPAPSAVAAAAPGVAFDRGCVGNGIKLSQNGLSATALRADGQCVLVSEQPVPRAVMGAQFSVAITAVRAGAQEGLGIGFTSTAPRAIGRPPPDSANEVQNAWLAGYDGATWNGAAWSVCDWEPSTLAKGDVVQATLSPAGLLSIAVNGVARCSLATSAPRDTPVYALVDLLGASCGVALQPAKGGATGADTSPSGAMVMARQEAISGFDRLKIGKSLRLQKGGTVATKETGASEFVTALSDRPVERSALGAASFAVSVTKVAQGSEEGLAIGFTATAPADLKRLPSSSDQIADAWLVGFDGATWNGQQWGLGQWRPRDLQVGDEVAASMSSQGMLEVKVNGTRVQALTTTAPASARLFAVVDLLGNTAAVQLLDAGASGRGRG